VFAWRRQYRQGLLGEVQEAANLLPVHFTRTRVSKAHRAGRRQVAHGTTEAAGAIYVELPKGQLLHHEAQRLRVQTSGFHLTAIRMRVSVRP